MIPAKTSCPPSWTEEYEGYIMTENTNSNHFRSTYECVDKSQESLPGSHGNVDESLFYHVEVVCGGLLCPPYDPAKELTCVMCTM